MMRMPRVPLATVRRAAPPASNVPPWHDCCASCSAGTMCSLAECDDGDMPSQEESLRAALTPSPEKSLRAALEGLAGEADDAEGAVDGMHIFAELIDVLLVIHEKRPDSGEKLERVAGAGRGVMSDVQLVAKH